MSATTDRVLDTSQLNDTDEQLLDVLGDGRVTPTYAAGEADVSREYTSERLKRLAEHGHVEKVAPGLYELVDDPRENVDAVDEDTRDARQRVMALREERDGLQEQLADAHERIDGLEERLRQQRVTADRIAGDFEAALEVGDQRRVEAALERLENLAEGSDAE